MRISDCGVNFLIPNSTFRIPKLKNVSLLFYSIQWSSASYSGWIKNPIRLFLSREDGWNPLAFRAPPKSNPRHTPPFCFHLPCLLWASTLSNRFGNGETRKASILGFQHHQCWIICLGLHLFFLRNLYPPLHPPILKGELIFSSLYKRKAGRD